MPMSDVATADWEAWSCRVRLAVTAPAGLAEARAVLRGHLAAVDRACSRFRADSELAGSTPRPAGGPTSTRPWAARRRSEPRVRPDPMTPTASSLSDRGAIGGHRRVDLRVHALHGGALLLPPGAVGRPRHRPGQRGGDRAGERDGVEAALLVVGVGHDVGPLLGEPAAAGRHHAGTDVAADLQVTGVGAAALGQDGDVQLLQFGGPPGVVRPRDD